jgi:hypothetical protein
MSSGIDRQPPVCCYAKHANFLTMRLQSFRGFWKMVNVITLTSPVNASTALHLPKKDKQLLTSCPHGQRLPEAPGMRQGPDHHYFSSSKDHITEPI